MPENKTSNINKVLILTIKIISYPRDAILLFLTLDLDGEAPYLL